MHVERGVHAEVRSAGPVGPPGTGDGRHAFAGMVDEGHDAVFAMLVVYGIVEGFSRESGNTAGDPYRFHNGLGPHAGMGLPEGLDMETLSDRARDAMRDERLFDGLTVEQIEEVALVVGADAYRDRAGS